MFDFGDIGKQEDLLQLSLSFQASERSQNLATHR